MPPVLYRRTGRGFWNDFATVFNSVDDDGWTFAFTLKGLIDLVAVIPGPATVDFTKIPADQGSGFFGWREGRYCSMAKGTQCIASYCLQIIRALPEHSRQNCV